MSGRCIIGDCLTVLPTLESGSVQMCCTSPPYWGLRSYGIGTENGELGLEPTPEEYVAKMVAVFREVRRVLRDDGTLWLNLGDSYSSSGKGGNPADSPFQKQATNEGSLYGRPTNRTDKLLCGEHLLSSGVADSNREASFLKPKDLVGIPWRVAFGLQNDGWYLRSEITWCKRAPMPESVIDRPTSATEKIFLMSKSESYYYDADAVRNPPSEAMLREVAEGYNGSARKLFDGTGAQDASAVKSRIIEGARKRVDKQRGHGRRHAGFNDRWDGMTKAEQMACGSNMRNWWLLGPEPYPDAHFATFPSEIPERCILAGSKPGDTVLDPFGGSGTTGQVAESLGRQWLLIELNPEYEKLLRDRTAQQGLQLSPKEVSACSNP